MPCGFTTPLSCEQLRWLWFPLPLHCFALFNHGQVTPFMVIIAAFGRFMRRSRIPKHSCRHVYSRCEVRNCGAGMHRSAAEGRFGEMHRRSLLRREPARSAPEGAARRCAEPEGCANTCEARRMDVYWLRLFAIQFVDLPMTSYLFPHSFKSICEKMISQKRRILWNKFMLKAKSRI